MGFRSKGRARAEPRTCAIGAPLKWLTRRAVNQIQSGQARMKAGVLTRQPVLNYQKTESNYGHSSTDQPGE